ncbi:GNAT family N-acetyltransferase [Exiguobacterium sp. SH3S2]|uniref:GNAT family N-acetyltransferase n=1 Tax=unclassified Exiguobacterium TaxID=2644629 RepID=UPI00103F4704|nr:MULTISPECIES: GNAT family N-acetyltransferase [unclassified Exiguobacterium]TCI44833.1 GNAT family N-acetyltransferase [Exiguobacterium sp. SH3S3]TCI53962.1 GNAT family N-acetyltransferase [Exiguobacterium sp. SH5S13]TCI60254.1 GNAT family N-acetyltransferase [Exiguobacterium sp. SH3S2]TCI64284.1 GNAT family N-acetyltransferase [Exiguobacterium sp. SH3S1]
MIRRYEASDRERVAAFLMTQQAFAALNAQTLEVFRDENLADFEETGTVSLVVEDDGAIVAMADLLRRHPIDGSLWLGLLLVDEQLHGTGLAQKVYDQLERDHMRPFQTTFRLGVLPTNVRARRFWERQGYVYEQDSVTGDGVHVHVLKKDIE